MGAEGEEEDNSADTTGRINSQEAFPTPSSRFVPANTQRADVPANLSFYWGALVMVAASPPIPCAVFPPSMPCARFPESDANGHPLLPSL
jgi:hypothetical protein